VGTYASLTIPWTVKRAIDALQADAAAAPVGYFVALIALSAVVNGLARLGSRFAITGGCQRIESEIRTDLFAALQAFPPRFYATHSTGDLIALDERHHRGVEVESSAVRVSSHRPGQLQLDLLKRFCNLVEVAGAASGRIDPIPVVSREEVALESRPPGRPGGSDT